MQGYLQKPLFSIAVPFQKRAFNSLIQNQLLTVKKPFSTRHETRTG